VYTRIAPSERAQWHTKALDELARDPMTPPAVLAAHALSALPLLDADRAVALAARAGEAAFDQVAYEEAVGWFEHALRVAPPTTAPRWRAELLVLAGEANRHMGATDNAREAFRAAAALAGDEPALLARAALGHADPGADLGIAYRTEDPVTAELLEQAERAQPEGDSLLRVLLGARLAAELYFSDMPSRSRDLAVAACEMAHRLDDPHALVAATAVYHDAFVVGQGDVEERLRSSEQMLAWARASGVTTALLTAHRARVFDLLAAADLEGMQREVVAFRRLTDPLHVPAYDWWPALWRAMRALLHGEHGEAERLAFDAFVIGQPAFGALALGNVSFLLFFLRREQGRLAELETTVRDYAMASADVPAIRVGLILLLAELGRHDEAAGLLAAIDDDELARLHDRNWPATWFQLARTCLLVGDQQRARELLEAGTAPEHCVTVSLATVCLGASDLGTAWLRHAAGELDAADEAYQRAEELNGRLDARSWLALTRVDHARLLLERGGPGDDAAARALIELAGAAAVAIGLAPVATAVDELRDRLEQGPAPPPSVEHRRGAFRRMGNVWELGFAGRVARVPHARGLTDLAVLVARPGTAVPAIELLGMDDATEPTRVRGALALDERARREIRARMRDLDEEIDDAEEANDFERAARAREERQAIAAAVVKDLGLGGRSRRVNDPLERARKTVSTRIRRTIARLGREHPELARHLERSIDTGAWCAYRPAEPVVWDV
jgi:tetratricopeptide (TPR) repeat protein